MKATGGCRGEAPPSPHHKHFIAYVRLVLLEEDARLLDHVLVAVHVGEVREDGLDGELVEVIDVLHVARVVHLVLDGIGHVGCVHEPLQEGRVRSTMQPRRDVELVMEIATARVKT